MAKALLFVLFAFALPSFADMKVTPVVPIDCQKVKKPTNVTMMTVLPGVNEGERVKFSLLMTYMSCHSGLYEMKEIKDDFNFYLLNQEYSRDFQSNYVRTEGKSDLAIDMSMIPDQFFELQDQRHFTISFYPTAVSDSYGWSILFSRDPQTKEIHVSALPL